MSRFRYIMRGADNNDWSLDISTYGRIIHTASGACVGNSVPASFVVTSSCEHNYFAAVLRKGLSW